MHFHGAYFANNSAWNKDPKHYLPSAHSVWSLVSSDVLNSDIGSYFQGIHINAGISQLWRSEGIITQVHLKLGCAVSLISSIICIIGCYFHTHISWSSIGFCTKLTILSVHHLSLLFGLGSICWSGHIIHISAPINCLLDSGIDPAVVPSLQDLLFFDYQEIIPSIFSASSIIVLILFGHFR